MKTTETEIGVFNNDIGTRDRIASLVNHLHATVAASAIPMKTNWSRIYGAVKAAKLNSFIFIISPVKLELGICFGEGGHSCPPMLGKMDITSLFEKKD